MFILPQQQLMRCVPENLLHQGEQGHPGGYLKHPVGLLWRRAGSTVLMLLPTVLLDQNCVFLMKGLLLRPSPKFQIVV